MRMLTGLGLTAFLLAGPALAHEPDLESRYSPAYRPCMDNADSTLAMIDCANVEYEAQDRALNAIYRTKMASLNGRQQARLRDAQRAWIAWRTARCAAQRDENWGTLSNVTAAMCRVDTTLSRVIELEEYPPV